MKARRVNLDYWGVVTLLTLFFFIVFFIYPVLQIFIQSVYNPQTGEFSLDSFRRFFSRSYYTSTILNSFKVTIAATAITMVTGMAIAVHNPIIANITNEKIGKDLYVNANITIKGKVDIIEK